MDSRRLSDDIVVLREPNEQRAVLIRGKKHYTAIDIPTERESFRELMAASKTLANGGLNLAILTRDVDDSALADSISPLRIVRGDRNPDAEARWDTVPSNRLRNSRLTVQLIRSRSTLHDDAGRAFHVEPCTGEPSTLAVLVEPESVLVVCDDLRPGLPPRLANASVDHTIARYEEWLISAPLVLVPASGIPIAGDQVSEVLRKSISYLTGLRSRVQLEMSTNRFPWERLANTIEWCDHWEAAIVTKPLYERHRLNVHAVAADVWRTKFPELADMATA